MCPVCREPMVAFEFEGIEVDRCLECGGTWLDAGELEAIAERAGGSAGELSRALEASKAGRRVRRRCPRCPHRLREFPVGRPELVLDHCPVGHGLWFDRGEMRALIRSCSPEHEAAVARFFADLYQGEAQEGD